jgi:proteasome lid subunit RPN8/RPN11
MPFRLQIPRPLLERMLAHARTEFPNECCGMLAGRLECNPAAAAPMQVGLVLGVYPLVNEAASPVEFLSSAQSMFAAVRDMDRQGLETLAVYHSHPSTAAVPSRTDLARNYSEDVMNLIISLSTEPEVRAWWLTEKVFREAEWECVEAGGDLTAYSSCDPSPS